jgi:hypothetical protein
MVSIRLAEHTVRLYDPVQLATAARSLSARVDYNLTDITQPTLYFNVVYFMHFRLCNLRFVIQPGKFEKQNL